MSVQFINTIDRNAVGLRAAWMVQAQLNSKPDSSIVFPTGNTPLPMYEALGRIRNLDWSRSRLFQLDEYCQPEGMDAFPPGVETFAGFLDRVLWSRVDAQKFYLKDMLDDPMQYEGLVRANRGPDLTILGIGMNGHIAFNEPGSPSDSPTRRVDLAEETLVHNFGEERLNRDRAVLPRQAVTLGLSAILASRRILLLATGSRKRGIIRKAFGQHIAPSVACPASWLKMHPYVTVLTDFSV